MPFISKTDQRETLQGLTAYEDVIEPTFGEVFDASVGQVFDEALSISGALNREGWRDRQAKVKTLLDSRDDLNREDYIDRRGRFDYDRFAGDAQDESIKTDQQLEQERREYLELKRNYAQDVQERGSGMAQFLGMATGFVLDPINAATMGTGTSITATRATTTIGRAMLTARDAAAISSATELMIQPLVYQHKSDIESPYAAGDAIEAIAGAAMGGAAIGAFTGGLSGYFKSVRETAQELPQTKEIEAAIESIEAFERTLEAAPPVDPIDIDRVKGEFISEIREELTAGISPRLSRGERKSLQKELEGLRSQLNRVDVVVEPVEKTKGVPARKAKKIAAEKGEALASQERAIFEDQIAIIENRLAESKKGEMAEADLSRLEQGIIPGEYAPRWAAIQNELEIENQANFLRQLEAQKQISNAPSRTPDQYDIPEEVIDEPGFSVVNEVTVGDDFFTPDIAAGRQSELLDNLGIRQDFDRDMQAFGQIESPKAIMDGEIVDAAELMRGFDEELEGINSVMVCTRG